MNDYLSSQLGRQVVQLRFDDLPRDTIEMARRGFIDTLAVMLGGQAEPVVGRLLSAEPKGPEEATLFFGTDRTSSETAALIGGTAAHILDYDDVSLRCHISAVLVPVILAEAERLHLTGADMIAAYVAGYEVMAELVEREPGVHNAGGWHTTAMHGTVAAAAAVASLRRFTPHQAAQAMCISASLASGIMANFGSMTKSVHAGLAAQKGVQAARLIEAGIDASPDALDHPRGFLRAVSPDATMDTTRPAHDFHADPQITRVGLNIKRYPVCYCCHRLIDGMLELKDANAPAIEHIERIEVHLSETWAGILRNAAPKTALEAKFSAQFAVSAALIAGNVGLAELTDDFVRRPDVQALMTRVAIVPNTDYDPILTGAAVADHSTVFLRDGARIGTRKVTRAKGHADDPLDARELKTKFVDCLSYGGKRQLADPLHDALLELETRHADALLTRLPVPTEV